MKGIELCGPVSQDGLRVTWAEGHGLPPVFSVPLPPVSIGKYLPKDEDGILQKRRRVFRRTDRVTRDGLCFIYVWERDEVS